MSHEEVKALAKDILSALLVSQSKTILLDESSSIEDYCQLLSSILTTISYTLPNELCNKIETLLQHTSSTPIITCDQLLKHKVSNFQNTTIALIQSDITCLQVDAIVNAANDRLLGCFIPGHKCIDNVIHAKSGPRLRNAMIDIMLEQQGRNESIGEAKLTSGYCLPSSHIIHTVGPQAQYEGHEQPELLSSCYKSCLDSASAAGLKSIAFCCISTGVFRYPNLAACRVALSAVKSWLQDHEGETSIELIVFDVFLENDLDIYTREIPTIFTNINRAPKTITTNVQDEDALVAANWIKEADHVLVCAGAGMSYNPGYNVYSSKSDFTNWYPSMPNYGYNTSYECMGIFSDSSIPIEVKWGYQAYHMNNMRYSFPPCDGYSTLLDLIKNKDYWVHTSNVDGAFVRSGFDENRIYKPQGDWELYQCRDRCRDDAIWKSEPLLEKLLPSIDGDTQQVMDLNKIPKCKFCGSSTFGNVRGGSWFIHEPQLKASVNLEKWIKQIQDSKKKLVILEIGAGFNTPTVTRIPMECITRQTPSTNLIRINPSDSELPVDLVNIGKAISVQKGWEFLYDIQKVCNNDKSGYTTSSSSSSSSTNSTTTNNMKTIDYRSSIPRYNDGSAIEWDYFYHVLRR